MSRNNMNQAYSRSRLRLLRRRQMIVGGALLAVALVVIIALAVTLGRQARDRAVTAANVTPEPTQALELEEAEEDVEPTPTPSPTKSGERTAAQRAKTRPTPTAEGFIPIFSRSETTEKIVAITVDDCYQGENLEKIVDAAIKVGGKLTLFPIGENVIREKQAQVLKYAWENGFELENHTYTHNGLYQCSNGELAEEIYKQQLALCYILGVEYQPHFLRPRGGDARRDQRMQMYADQLGYYGIAHWSVDGSKSSRSALAKALKPGAIFLFHTTDNDLSLLRDFIPWVASKGYRLVTLNEMFGYPENETGKLATPVSKHKIPALEPYKVVYTPLKKTTYSYYALLLQKKLIKLGYLKGKADGIYARSSVEAVKKYQKDHKLKVTGIADAKLQQALIGK